MTDEKRDGYIVRPDATAASVKRESKYRPDGQLDTESPIGDEFEQVFDELNDLHTGAIKNRAHYQDPDEPDPISGERERMKIERELTMIADTMRGTLNDQLRAHGFTVTAVTFDKQYDFRISAVDSSGLMFPVTIPLDAMNELSDLSTKSGYLKICEYIVGQVLAARARYGNAGIAWMS